MIKEFSILLSVVLLLAGFVSVHYILHDDISSKKILYSVVKVTNFYSPSLSVAYFEPRVLFYEEVLNPAYPQMQTINKMDLVYEQ